MNRKIREFIASKVPSKVELDQLKRSLELAENDVDRESIIFNFLRLDLEVSDELKEVLLPYSNIIRKIKIKNKPILIRESK